MSKVKPTVLAYYFPNWHVDPQNELWHGEGWTEWEVAKYATPRFEGHYQPRIPLNGYQDESDPEVMAQKIDDAVNYGVDGFIFDWYWFNDGGYRLKCLDEGFLGAKNCEKAKFAIMWCNHDPIYAHPAAKHTGRVVLKSGDLNVQSFVEGTNHCIKNYFCKPNYLRNSKGKLYFSIFLSARLIDNFGGIDGAKVVIKDFRNRVREAGLGEIDLNAIVETSVKWKDDYKLSNKIMKEIGFDSFSSHSNRFSLELPFPHEEYAASIKKNVERFEENTLKSELPYNIHIYQGYDCSPRTVQSDVYGDYKVYPFDRIVSGNTPELFEDFCRQAKEFYYSRATGEYITVFSWNEWTEGGYLEPDTKYGYGFLEAIKNVFMD